MFTLARSPTNDRASKQNFPALRTALNADERQHPMYHYCDTDFSAKTVQRRSAA
jgi:hypothetical protein